MRALFVTYNVIMCILFVLRVRAFFVTLIIIMYLLFVLRVRVICYLNYSYVYIALLARKVCYCKGLTLKEIYTDFF